MSDLHELTAAEQLRALRTREISAGDLTEHYLERIERHSDLGAFVTVTADLAREEAARADRRLAAGDEAPLLGLPLGIKDLHPTAGVRTTFGSAAMADHVPLEDSWTVARIREAGAVLLGKTTASELGATCFTHEAVTRRPAVTPYDRTRYSSGSSGGAATAVAAGLLPVAHGSDGAGSTRTPAATCHLVGVKPSRGLVSGAPGSSYLAIGSEGPLARTVEDAALLLDVMAQPAPGDLYGWRPTEPLTRLRDPEPLRVAAWTETGIDGVEPHPESVRAVARAVARLRDLGHEVVEVAVPVRYDETTRHALVSWFAANVATTVATVLPGEERGVLTPYTQHLVSLGDRLTGQDVVLMQGALARFAGAHLEALADVDVALTPTVSGPPVPIGHFTAEGPEQVADRMLAWSCFTPWANLTGQPAVSLPSHLDADGLPHGVQLVGRPRDDARLLGLAAQLERAALWSPVHPTCWET